MASAMVRRRSVTGVAGHGGRGAASAMALWRPDAAAADGDGSVRRQGQGAAARAQWRKGTGGVRVDCVDPMVVDVCTNLKHWKVDKKKTSGRYI